VPGGFQFFKQAVIFLDFSHSAFRTFFFAPAFAGASILTVCLSVFCVKCLFFRHFLNPERDPIRK